MRLLAIAAVALLAGCGPAPVETSRVDAPSEDADRRSADELAALNRQVESLVQSGKSDAAAALLTKGESLANRLLAAPRPTIEAVEAISDHDDLYGRMLLANGNYGWARLMFQKNLVRWKVWKPQTAETERRRQLAQSAIAECDRHLE
ncbi:MAG: hypothetical protein LAP40_04515 [Acidobacteriia bacterium]|nr:hypothetical protein [Terriglobia bacterium]